MKHLFTFLLLLVFAHTAISQKRIESFDVPLELSDYRITKFTSNDSTWVSHSQDTLNVLEGKASLKIEYSIRNLEDWGSSTTLAMQLPLDQGNWDFSGYDKITFNLYNEVKSSTTGGTHLQLMLYDNSEFPTDNRKEFWIAYLWPFDLEPGWNTITVPLKDVGLTAQSEPGSGFWLSTNAGNMGNETLDLNKIVGVGFSIVSNIPASGSNLSGSFLVDNLMLIGEAPSASGEELVESFDVPLQNTDYRIVNFNSNDNSRITQSLDKSNVYEGEAALKMEYSIRRLENSGSASTLALQWDDEINYWDFSGYDSISFYLYNEVKSSTTGGANLHLILYDKSDFSEDVADNRKEFWYSYLSPFDLEPGWNKITIPLKDVGPAAQSKPGSGFWLSGAAGHLGNETLDLDKISGVGFSIVVAASADNADISGTFLVDKLMLIGEKHSVSGEELIESFNTPIEEKDYRIVNFKSNDNSGITQSLDMSNVYEGEAALKMEYSIRSLEDWGSASTLAMQWGAEINYWDFSGYDSISFYLYNEVKASEAGRAKLQFILNDKSDFGEDGTDNRREFWFSYLSPFDLEPGWNKITIPLKDVGPAAQSNPGSGFWLSGAAGHLGNETLDLDKISGVSFSVVVAGPADNADVSGTFLIDNLHLVGKNTTTSANTLKTESNGFSLEQNYPNPFYNETTVKFKIPKQQKVTLSIFDVSGKAINVLINETLTPGDYKVNYSAKDLPSGVYYYQLRTGEFMDTKKLIVSR